MSFAYDSASGIRMAARSFTREKVETAALSRFSFVCTFLCTFLEMFPRAQIETRIVVVLVD
jgi:hypothetical protein